MRQVSILGVGSTVFSRHPDRGSVDLAVSAARQAILEANVARERIGAVYLGNFVGGVLTGQEVLAGLVADGLGLHDVPCTKVEGACASGGIAFRHAVLAVAAGLCDVALAVGVEKMSHAGTSAVTKALNCALDHAADGASGLTYPGLFALVWQAHARRYGTTREQVSAVCIKNRRNGLTNPIATMGSEITADLIANATMIADPLTLYDCCPISDGASAVIVGIPELARAAAADPVRVLASVQTSGGARIAAHGDLTSFRATCAAAERAYADAGIRPADVNFVELHDCFSIAEIVDSEDLGLIPAGEGGHWALEGRTSLGGDLPINASGGLEAKGHPVGATGIGQIYEAVQQLRGRHPNQVKGARVGMTHNLGGTGVACTVSILGKD